MKKRVLFCPCLLREIIEKKIDFFLFYSWFFLLDIFSFFKSKFKKKTRKNLEKNKKISRTNQVLFFTWIRLFFSWVFLVFFLEFDLVFYLFFLILFLSISSLMVKDLWALLGVYTSVYCYCLYLNLQPWSTPWYCQSLWLSTFKGLVHWIYSCDSYLGRLSIHGSITCASVNS